MGRLRSLTDAGVRGSPPRFLHHAGTRGRGDGDGGRRAWRKRCLSRSGDWSRTIRNALGESGNAAIEPSCLVEATTVPIEDRGTQPFGWPARALSLNPPIEASSVVGLVAGTRSGREMICFGRSLARTGAPMVPGTLRTGRSVDVGRGGRSLARSDDLSVGTPTSGEQR